MADVVATAAVWPIIIITGQPKEIRTGRWPSHSNPRSRLASTVAKGFARPVHLPRAIPNRLLGQMIDQVLELFKVRPRWLLLRVETELGVVGWGEPNLEGFPTPSQHACES